GAFTAIINSLVADVIGPIIGLIIGGKDFSAMSFGIGDAQIMYGNFINAIITFLLTAIVLFFIVKAFNKFDELKKKEEPEEEAPAEPEPSDEAKLLIEIRDLLKK
ncbi:MAG: large conductance mechanosensitive channel protein MscL, partial [Firmicutes bacterium]|nr:large conductance mechanosensitive channel protein MscL [Bacillota bacterium]